MHHVNKRFSENYRLFCITFFSFFMITTLTITAKNKEPEKQIEHETEVQSNTETIEDIKDLETATYTEKLKTNVSIRPMLTQELLVRTNENIQEEIEQETEADRIKTSKAETSDSIETQEPELPKRENRIYYIQDDGYRFDLSEEYQDYLWQLCKEYEVTDYYELFIAQMYHESCFDETVVSQTNDYGLMQINKCNHQWLSEKLGNGDFLDPYNNMEAGVLIMSGFLQKYSDVHKALVCYNRGESAVINGTYSTSYSKCVISDMDKLIEIK